MSLANRVWREEVGTAQGVVPKKCLNTEQGGVKLISGAGIQIKLNKNHLPTILKTDYIKSPGFIPKIPKC